MSKSKVNNSVNVQLSEETKKALVDRVGVGEVSKVIRKLLEMFMANQIEVVIPGVEAKKY